MWSSFLEDWLPDDDEYLESKYNRDRAGEDAAAAVAEEVDMH